MAEIRPATQMVPSEVSDWLNGDDPAMVQRVTSAVSPMESSASSSCNARQKQTANERTARCG